MTMEKRGLPRKNVVGLASASASVMAGVCNSVLIRIQSKKKVIFFSFGYLCCLANLCATGL